MAIALTELNLRLTWWPKEQDALERLPDSSEVLRHDERQDSCLFKHTFGLNKARDVSPMNVGVAIHLNDRFKVNRSEWTDATDKE